MIANKMNTCLRVFCLNFLSWFRMIQWKFTPARRDVGRNAIVRSTK
jgi:hypothetical protein